MTINVKVNSLNTSIFGTTPVKDGLSVVPSYLMKTPSTDFAIEKDRISNTGIFALASTNTYDSDTHTSTITLTALEGYFQSTIGKHYLKIRENAILDLVGFEDGEYILSLELVFIDGGDTELNFHINLSSDPIIGEKLANLTIATYEITNFTLVPVITIEQSLRDKLDTYNRNEVDVNIAELESQLITLIQNIATSNAQGQFGAIYDPVIEISPTPVTLTFDVEKQSTDTTLFEINTDNTFTFKDVGDFNYVSSVTFQSEGSQSVLETVTFSVVNTDDESVILTNAKDINISGTDTATIQFNTLFNIPSGTTFPLNVRIDVVSTGSDYTINSLTSILMSSNNVGLIASAQGITFDSETSRLTKTNVQEALKEVADTSALLGGSATQSFKVKRAITDDEAVNKGQINKMIDVDLSANFTISTTDDTVVVFDNINHQDSDLFTFSDGIVTVTRNCKILINAGLTVYNGDTNEEYNMYVAINNGRELWSRFPKESGSDQYKHLNMSRVFNLASGDDIRVYVGCATDDDYYIRALDGSYLSIAEV